MSQAIIKQLPLTLANQIAAGEVVHRPANAVKELMENAIDAGATEIHVFVREAGRSLIQVVDNGKGMNPSDAVMCFKRHATSKIASPEDLQQLMSFGFRGEALAAISAVSQVELRTRTADTEEGTQVNIEGNDQPVSFTCVCPVGTSIAVKNLFFNVPARRNFLKSNQVEFAQIHNEFIRIALSHPDITFRLVSNSNELYYLMPSKLGKRIVDVFGDEYRQNLANCEEENQYFKLDGFLGKPQSAKKTKGEQYLFVNNRYVRHPYLQRAITNAYEGLIKPDTQPFYVLFLSVDPSRVDVNVHPAKTEVKFVDDQVMFPLIQSTVKRSLAQHNMMPLLDFAPPASLESFKPGEPLGISESDLSPMERELIDRSMPPLPTVGPKPVGSGPSVHRFPGEAKRDPEGWEKLFVSSFESQARPTQSEITLPSRSNRRKLSVPTEQDAYIQIANTYVATAIEQGMLLIHQERASARILYERYIAESERATNGIQVLVFPKIVQLPMADWHLLHGHAADLKQLGWELDTAQTQQVVIKGIPTDLPQGDEEEALADIVNQLAEESLKPEPAFRKRIARTMAKRHSVKAGQPLSRAEMHELVEQVMNPPTPLNAYGLDGGALYTVVDEAALARML